MLHHHTMLMEFLVPNALRALLITCAFVSQAWGLDSRCDLYKGEWVRDDSYPLFDSSSCPYIPKEFDCQRNGRPDSDYLKFRWKPDGCDPPRFDGLRFLERWRGKQIMFVGDSLSLNQWVSFLCLLHAAAPGTGATAVGPPRSVTFKEHAVSVSYYHSLFLIDLVNEPIGRVLKLDSIEGGKAWLDADLLIFNTWHWWPRNGSTQPWDFIEEGGRLYKDMDRLVAFSKGLPTWARWVESNIDPIRTKVFYQGVSPNHYSGADWGEPNVTGCSGQARPSDESTHPPNSSPPEEVVREVIGSIAKTVHLLDVTSLSQSRKDGHPSRYGIFPMDCSHWCVAGVADTWNQLMYANLF